MAGLRILVCIVVWNAAAEALLLKWIAVLIIQNLFCVPFFSSIYIHRCWDLRLDGIKNSAWMTFTAIRARIIHFNKLYRFFPVLISFIIMCSSCKDNAFIVERHNVLFAERRWFSTETNLYSIPGLNPIICITKEAVYRVKLSRHFLLTTIHTRRDIS